MSSFGFMELLLMSVLQHAVHHSAAMPHIKQRLSMLVSHLLKSDKGKLRLTSKHFHFKKKENSLGVQEEEESSQRSHQICQNRAFRNGRWEAGCTRSNRCLGPPPAASHSRRKPVVSGSLPCLEPRWRCQRVSVSGSFPVTGLKRPRRRGWSTLTFSASGFNLFHSSHQPLRLSP